MTNRERMMGRMTTLVTKGNSKKIPRVLLEMLKECSLQEAMQNVSERKATTERPDQHGSQ